MHTPDNLSPKIRMKDMNSSKNGRLNSEFLSRSPTLPRRGWTFFISNLSPILVTILVQFVSFFWFLLVLT